MSHEGGLYPSCYTREGRIHQVTWVRVVFKMCRCYFQIIEVYKKTSSYYTVKAKRLDVARLYKRSMGYVMLVQA